MITITWNVRMGLANESSETFVQRLAADDTTVRNTSRRRVLSSEREKCVRCTPRATIHDVYNPIVATQTIRA